MHTKLKSFILTALLFAIVSGIKAQTDSSAPAVPVPQAAPAKKPLALNKIIGKWYLVPALDSDTATGRVPEIQFDIKESKFSGNTGCNRMSGTFVATDSTIQFSDKMITTRMFCSGYNESAFLQNLLRVESYKFKKSMLVFLVGDIEVFRWTRKNPLAKKPVKPQTL